MFKKRQSTEPEPEPELQPAPIPQWIEEIISNVVIPPPPKCVFYCQICGQEVEILQSFPRSSFCDDCMPKYNEYCDFVNHYRLHDVQSEALRKAIYCYNPGNGEKYEWSID